MFYSKWTPPTLPFRVKVSLKSVRLYNDYCMFNTGYFRKNIQSIGYSIKDGIHPIVPIMLGDAKLAQQISKEMLKKKIFVAGFSYPVVPRDQARIRVQLSASHSQEQLDYAIKAFKNVGTKLNLF